MFIKQVIINGFKSYRDRTVVDPFHKGLNVFVGRNGAGKSNFFDAILFVLTNNSKEMKRSKRNSILYDGNKTVPVHSAYVEIIFDNSDKSIPIDQIQVILRRTVNLEYDKYTLNGKTVKHIEVLHLLEMSGITNSNPYCVVKQGKINEMATASDKDRLHMFMEIAKPKRYSEKVDECKKTLEEGAVKIRKTTEYFETLDTLIRHLENEHNDVKEFRRLDKNKQLIERVIYKAELERNTRKLEEIKLKIARTNQSQAYNNLRDEIVNVKAHLEETNKELLRIAVRKVAISERIDFLSTEQEKLIKSKATDDLIINDLTKEVQEYDGMKIATELKLKDLMNQIENTIKEIAQMQPQYMELVNSEVKILKELAIKQQEKQNLYVREAHNTHCKTKMSRDICISSKLENLAKQIEYKSLLVTKIQKEIVYDMACIEIMEEEEKMARDLMLNTLKELDSIYVDFYGDKEELQRVDIAMSIQLLDILPLRKTITVLEEKQDAIRLNLEARAGIEVKTGLNKLRMVLLKCMDIGGEIGALVGQCCGILGTLFDCDQSLYAVVEAIAGEYLFYVVVHTHKVANYFNELSQFLELPGVLNFLPLDELQIDDIQYPTADGVFPLISRMKPTKSEFNIILKFVFGKVLICENSEIASGFPNFDCFTMEKYGNFTYVLSDGTLRGGYLDKSLSFFESQRMAMDLSDVISQFKVQLDPLTKKLPKIEALVPLISSVNNSNGSMLEAHTRSFERANMFARRNTQEIYSTQMALFPKRDLLTKHVVILATLEAEKYDLEKELQQELEPHTDPGQLFVELNEDIHRLTQEHKLIFDQKMDCAAKLMKNFTLKNKMLSTVDDMVQPIHRGILEGHKHQLFSTRKIVSVTETLINKYNALLGELETELQSAIDKEKELKAELDLWSNKKNEVKRRMDDILNKKNHKLDEELRLENDNDNLLAKINAARSLPQEPGLEERYENMPLKELYKEFANTKKLMENYRNINLKAFEQLEVFTKQRQEVFDQREELLQTAEKIKSMWEAHNQEWNALFRIAFDQVKKNFAMIFKKLVPLGRASLEMVVVREKPTGINTRVSFTGCETDTNLIHQLSGGQKTLVAFALILAIQKFDPSPVYIIDEIDQALGTVYREIVAETFHDLTYSSQFLISTFRPEAVMRADKCYGVMFHNNTSRVDTLSREEAIEFTTMS